MTSPTPIDALVWSYHRLGWSTRRIAGEVQTSQATVVRILERLRKEPPRDMTTPPAGIPAIFPAYDDETVTLPRVRRRRSGVAMLMILNLLLIGALAATLAAASGGLIARGRQGVPGPAGPRGPAGSQGAVELCARYSSYTGAIVELTAPVKGSCGTATLIRITP